MGVYETSPKSVIDLLGKHRGLQPSVLRVPSPWNRLNSLLAGGFYGGELILVSGCGLTNTLSVFIRSLVLYASEVDTPTFYMNNKGSNSALSNQFILGRVPIDKNTLWDTDKLTPTLCRRIEAAKGRAAELPLVWHRVPVSLERLELEAKESRIQGNAFFVIDPVSLLSPDNGSVDEIIFRLKQFAVECGVPVLVSLESFKHEDKERTLEDFPGSVLAHVDKMITLRDDNMNGKILNVVVVRNRDGELGTVILSYDSTRSALIEGEHIVPAYINEPVPVYRVKEGEESEEDTLQRNILQFVAMTEKLEEKAKLSTVKDAIRFIRKRVRCRTCADTLVELGFPDDKEPRYYTEKGSRYKKEIIDAFELLDAGGAGLLEGKGARIKNLVFVLGTIPPAQRKLALTVVKSIKD